MEITLGKYRTRGGGVAYVVADTGFQFNRFVGYVHSVTCNGADCAHARVWGSDGRLYWTLDDEWDLVERIE